MTNKNLYLIGTAHIDLKGPQRLERLLKRISPDIVALEFHKDRESLIEERKSVSPEVEEKETDDVLREVGLSLTPKQRKTMLVSGREITSVMGYEFTVCRDYAHANPKSRLEYIDISIFENGVNEFKEGYIAAMKGTLAAIAQEPELREPFLKTLSRGKKAFLQQSMDCVDSLYKNAEMMDELAEFLRDPETFEVMKEQMPQNAIQALEQIYNPQRDVAMANRINELYNSGLHRLVAVTGLIHIPGLKSRILELDPTTMTLADYDSN
jgi:hypothetical protein